jgi:hypothetical protein
MIKEIIQGAFVAAFVSVALSSPAFAEKAGIGWKETIAAKSGKAKTMAELAKMYDSSSCIECHQDKHDEAQKSIHSRSMFGTGRTAMTFMSAIEKGLMEEPYSGVKSPKDVKVDHRRKKDKAAVKREEDKLKSLNISCLVCHNRNAITHKWQDGYPKAGVVYGSKAGDHPSDTFPTMAVSPIMSEAIQCGQCHGLGPNLELDEPTQCCTSYGSYLWAYKAEVGQESCQDCHMKKSKLGHNIQSYRDPGMAKAAVDFKVEAFGYHWRDNAEIMPKAVVKVEMINRSGHSIPDG